MDHKSRGPNAGATDSSRPYFVMELVKDVPISESVHEEFLAADLVNQWLGNFVVTTCRLRHPRNIGLRIGLPYGVAQASVAEGIMRDAEAGHPRWGQDDGV
jgi:hypothetical protein